MNPLFIYLLKASVTVFILWSFYSLCLRRMTFHRLNRYFFLTGILVSLLWPALPLTEWFSKTPQVGQIIVYIPVSALMMQFKPEEPTLGFEMAFKIVYFSGVLFMLTRLGIQIFSLLAIFKKSEVQVINDVPVHVVKEKINPFSFFGYIFLNPANHSPSELSAIILHEKVHETRTHSIDILLSELFKIMLWFNPFSWLFCRAVKENIEFEVDRALLHQGIDCKEYQYSLLKLSAIKNQIVITNHFNLSNLKTRIIMMNKNQSSRYGLAAYLLVIPLILLCMVFSYTFAQDKQAITDTIKQLTSVTQKTEKLPDNPLIILDGKVIDKATMDAMNHNDIYAINVIKGKNATDIYGKKGKNGVILITSKKENSEKKTVVMVRTKDSTGTVTNGKPVIIIDGVQMGDDALKDLDPDIIQSINVLKGDMAKREFGEKGSNGVINITIKKNKTASAGDNSTSSYSSSSSDGKGYVVVTNTHTNVSDKADGKKESRVNVIFSDDDKKPTDDCKIQVIEKRTTLTTSGSGGEQHIVINGNSDEEIHLKGKGENLVFHFAKGAYILLDGKEIDEEAMKSVKPEDIESVKVLKGENATKTYGSKGSKGVILITTKKK